MTDRSRYGRRLAALAIVPVSAGVFGGGVAWAGSHDPLATPSPNATAWMPHVTSKFVVVLGWVQTNVAVIVPASQDFGIRTQNCANSSAPVSNAR